MEEIFKALGGIGGLISALTSIALLLYARIKIPREGVEMLRRELEEKRGEVEEADKERLRLRGEMRELRQKLGTLDTDYMHCLGQRERLKRRCRRLESD